MLDGPLALGHQREAAFSLVAQGAEQRVAGFGVDVELAAWWVLYRDVDARADPFIARNRRGTTAYPVGCQNCAGDRDLGFRRLARIR
jgi:hypothetical protein